MVSPAQIKYLLSLIEKQSFQRAAESCFVTQPTLSMQIRKAEAAMGGQIINRDTSPISLTSFGEMVIPQLEKIADDYNKLEDEIAKLKGTYKAEIRIGIIPTIAGYLVPDLYDQWQNQLGDIQLDIKELKTPDLIKAVEKKQIDFGVMAGPLKDQRFNQQRLFDEEIFVYSPKTKSKTISQEKLQELKPWLLSEGNCLRTQMINFCNLKQKHEDTWKYEGGSINMLLKMVEIQGGYTLVPSNYLPYLQLDKEDFKRVENIVPVRQIIGINLTRNSKKEHIQGLIRLIQRNKSNDQLHKIKTEILPWS
tara:strand:+ start:75575 stop:76495 length:921 start_codon:yes stop_codon:yes gene_type:complete